MGVLPVLCTEYFDLDRLDPLTLIMILHPTVRSSSRGEEQHYPSLSPGSLVLSSVETLGAAPIVHNVRSNTCGTAGFVTDKL